MVVFAEAPQLSPGEAAPILGQGVRHLRLVQDKESFSLPPTDPALWHKAEALRLQAEVDRGIVYTDQGPRQMTDDEVRNYQTMIELEKWQSLTMAGGATALGGVEVRLGI